MKSYYVNNPSAWEYGFDQKISDEIERLEAELAEERERNKSLPMGIREWTREVHTLAAEKGWWSNERTAPELHMLMVTEIAEATEEARKGSEPVYFEKSGAPKGMEIPEGEKPEGELIELADCVIRIMDYCGKKRWNLENAIKIKHEYNKTRPVRHGGKLF